MGVLKKLKQKRPVTIGSVSNVIVAIDDLKKQGVLKTNDLGFFQIYPDFLKSAIDKDRMCKNFYFYARTCKLISLGESLDLVDIDTNKLIAIITADKTTYFE